jgi:hypothetical protein
MENLSQIIAIKQKAKGDPADVFLRVFPWMLDELKDDPFDLELEILQGSRGPEVEGMIQLELIVTDENKIEALALFIKMWQLDEIFPPN